MSESLINRIIYCLLQLIIIKGKRKKEKLMVANGDAVIYYVII